MVRLLGMVTTVAVGVGEGVMVGLGEWVADAVGVAVSVAVGVLVSVAVPDGTVAVLVAVTVGVWPEDTTSNVNVRTETGGFTTSRVTT